MKNDYKHTYIKIKDPENLQDRINRIRRNNIRQTVREIESMDDSIERRWAIKSLPPGTRYNLKEEQD